MLRVRIKAGRGSCTFYPTKKRDFWVEMAKHNGGRVGCKIEVKEIKERIK